jgi:hypothetical protein
VFELGPKSLLASEPFVIQGCSTFFVAEIAESTAILSEKVTLPRCESVGGPWEKYYEVAP